MSIIEETLRTIQTKHGSRGHGCNDPVTSSVTGNVSYNPKSARYKTFVMMAIVLSVLGLAMYIGFDKYQNKLEERKEVLNYDQDFLKAEITSVVEVPKPPTTIKPGNKPQKFNNQPDITRQQSTVLSFELPQPPQPPTSPFQPPQSTMLADQVIGTFKDNTK